MSSTDKFENLEFGNVDIPEDALSGKSVKVRITMMVDADIDRLSSSAGQPVSTS